MRYIAYVLMGIMLISWAWMQINTGVLTKKQYYLFNIGMICGQLGVGVEAYLSRAHATVLVQLYFFVFTLYGCVRRK